MKKTTTTKTHTKKTLQGVLTTSNVRYLIKLMVAYLRRRFSHDVAHILKDCLFPVFLSFTSEPFYHALVKFADRAADQDKENIRQPCLLK